MRKNRIVLYLVALLQGMVFYASIATLYRESRGLSMGALGGIESASMLLTLLLELPWGALAGRLGYRRTLLLVNGMFFLSKIVFWQAYSFGGFLLERLMLSFVMAGLSGVDNALLYECCDGPDPKKVFGLWKGASTAGILLASMGYSLLMAGDFALAAATTALVYGLALGLTFLLKEPRRLAVDGKKPVPGPRPEGQLAAGETDGGGGDDRGRMDREAMGAGLLEGLPLRMLGAKLRQDLRAQRPFLPVLLAGGLLLECSQFVTVFLSQLQYRASGAPMAWMGFFHILLTLSEMAGLSSGWLCRVLGGRWVGRGCFALALAVCLILMLQRGMLLSLVCMMGLRACASVYIPMDLDGQNARADSRHRPWLLSVFSMVRSLLSVPLYLSFGALSEGHLAGAMRPSAPLGCSCSA